MQTYPLWLDNQEAGRVTVERKGLFYRFMCICNMPYDICFRICVRCGENITDLGICVPENGNFTLQKQMSIKCIGEGEMQFYIRNCKMYTKAQIQVFADKPFSEIDALEKAKLTCREGLYYIYWD